MAYGEDCGSSGMEEVLPCGSMSLGLDASELDEAHLHGGA